MDATQERVQRGMAEHRSSDWLLLDECRNDAFETPHSIGAASAAARRSCDISQACLHSTPVRAATSPGNPFRTSGPALRANTGGQAYPACPVQRESEANVPTNPFSLHDDSRQEAQGSGAVRVRAHRPLAPSSDGVMGISGIRPGMFDGTTPWEDYKAQFEVIADLHNWSPAVMAMCLAASLKGDAQAVLSDLDVAARRDYQSITDALTRRFSPTHQTEVHRIQLKNRFRKRDESLPELAHEVRRLTRQAYPNAPVELLVILARDHFIDALDDPDLRLGVYQARPQTMEEAVKAAMEIEAFHMAEKQRNFPGRKAARALKTQPVAGESSEYLADQVTKVVQGQMTDQQKLIAELQASVQAMSNEMSALREEVKKKPSYSTGSARGHASDPSADGNSRLCFYCKQPGHFKRNCRKRLQEMQRVQSADQSGNCQESGLGAAARQ